MIETQEKTNAAIKALSYINNEKVIGIGTGSTIEIFIKELIKRKRNNFESCVSSSTRTNKILKKYNIEILDINYINDKNILYFDGADEIDRNFSAIKGGGGALTREKILSYYARKFICIINEKKIVKNIGENFPLPVEIIPMSRSLFSKKIIQMGGIPKYRENFITDNNNCIIDVYNIPIHKDPLYYEKKINNIPGVVSNGIFSQRKPDILIVGKNSSSTILLNN